MEEDNQFVKVPNSRQIVNHMNKTEEDVPKGLLELQIRLMEEGDSSIHTMDKINQMK